MAYDAFVEVVPGSANNKGKDTSHETLEASSFVPLVPRNGAGSSKLGLGSFDRTTCETLAYCPSPKPEEVSPESFTSADNLRRLQPMRLHRSSPHPKLDKMSRSSAFAIFLMARQLKDTCIQLLAT